MGITNNNMIIVKGKIKYHSSTNFWDIEFTKGNHKVSKNELQLIMMELDNNSTKSHHIQEQYKRSSQRELKT